MGGENKDVERDDKNTADVGGMPDGESNTRSTNTQLTADVILDLTREQSGDSVGLVGKEYKDTSMGKPEGKQYSHPKSDKPNVGLVGKEYKDTSLGKREGKQSSHPKSDKANAKISIGNIPREEKSSTNNSTKQEKSTNSNSSGDNTHLSPDEILSLTRYQAVETGFGWDMPSETHNEKTENSHFSDSVVQDQEVTSVQESAPGVIRVTGIDGEQTTDTAVPPPSTELAPVEQLISATVVDDNVDEGTLRENIRQDVLREVAHTEGELVDVQKEEDSRRHIWLGMACCVLAISLGVGLGVGLKQDGNNNTTSSASSFTESPTESPSMAPTTEQCHMCYDPNNNEAARLSEEVQSKTTWRQTIIEQTPLRTCQNVFDETLDLSIWDEECTKLQADSSWKCECPEFPPIPEIVDLGNNTNSSSNTVRCKLCPEGFEAVPKSKLNPASICTRASTWLDVVGQNLTRDECDIFYRLAINGCECEKVDGDNNNNDGDSPFEMTTGQCISSLDRIISYENSEVDDETIGRTYVLCPNTSFKVGIANLAEFSTGNAIVDGQFPIVGRSNMKVLCGMDGSSANNCTIRDGSLGVFQPNGWAIQGSITQDNIHIQGVTFVNVTNPIAIYTVANVTIEDCIFDRYGGAAVLALPGVLPPAPSRRQHRNLRQVADVPRVLQPPVEPEADRGTIRVFRSIFRNGRILESEPSSTIWLRQPGNFATGPTAMSLHMDDCLFDARGNDEWYRDAIQAFGQGHFHVTNTCFWGGRYNRPVHTNEEEKSLVIGDEPDYFFDGNYYLRDVSNMSDTAQYCAMRRRRSEETCRAYFSGNIDVCTNRWNKELEDASTVHPGRVIELRTTCGTDEFQQVDYRGIVNVTSSGKSCQAWDSRFPHSHDKQPERYPNSGLESNYCRNPDGTRDERAWCYTTDPDVRSEFCDVPSC